MELKYIKTYRTIIDAGSFQNAAEKLNYSQSTVTFHIQQLEQELSVKLFERIGRRMVVTQAGMELLPHMNTILETFALMKDYNRSSKEPVGSLTIAMPESLLVYQSQKTIKLFREKAPKVKLSLQTQNCFSIREQISAGAIDLGIHYDVGGYHANIHTGRLGEYNLALICCPAFQKRDFTSAHQRKEVCLLTDDKNSIFFSKFTRYLAERDIVMENLIELGSIEAIKRSVASNVGVAILPKFAVGEELRAGLLDEIETGMEYCKITAIYAYHKNKWFSPAMECFLSLMKETNESRNKN